MNEYLIKVDGVTYYIEGNDVRHVNGFVTVWRYDECMAIIKDEELKYILNCGKTSEMFRCEEEDGQNI